MVDRGRRAQNPQRAHLVRPLDAMIDFSSVNQFWTTTRCELTSSELATKRNRLASRVTP
jgi:hypothetical protein